MSVMIGNPLGAYGRDDINSAQRLVFSYEAAGTISADDVVVFEAATGTEELVLVNSADVGTDNPALTAGVALHSAVAGDIVQVCVFGPAIVNCGDATIAAGDAMTFHASTDGAADGTAGVETLVEGDYFGIALSANDVPATDKCIVFVNRTI